MEYDDFLYDDRIQIYRNSIIEKRREMKINTILSCNRLKNSVSSKRTSNNDAILVHHEFSEENSTEYPPANVEYLNDQNLNIDLKFAFNNQIPEQRRHQRSTSIVKTTKPTHVKSNSRSGNKFGIKAKPVVQKRAKSSLEASTDLHENVLKENQNTVKKDEKVDENKNQLENALEEIKSYGIYLISIYFHIG